jgi:hypothetical protein
MTWRSIRYGNFQEVRATALEALIRLGVTPNPRSDQASGVLQHVLECLVRDKSPWLRYRALAALLSALDDTVLDLPDLRQQVFDCIKYVTPSLLHDTCHTPPLIDTCHSQLRHTRVRRTSQNSDDRSLCQIWRR